MFNLFKKKPPLTKQEATQIAEAVLPTYLASGPGLFPIKYATIVHEWTQKRGPCWVLYWNSKRFVETKNFLDQWIGPGLILVDRWTGYVRIYPSGHGFEVIDKYKEEKRAGGKAWCLVMTFRPEERTAYLAHLKTALGLTIQEIASLKNRLPGPVFTGHYHDLNWLAQKLREADLSCKVELCEPETGRRLEWFENYWTQRSVAEALEANREYPKVHGGSLEYYEFDCPLPELKARLEPHPKRAFHMTTEEQKARNEEMFDRAVLDGSATHVQYFLSMNVDRDRRISGMDGDTALHIAARQGNKDVIEALLRYASDVTIMNAQGHTAIEIASESGKMEIAELLREHEKKVNEYRQQI